MLSIKGKRSRLAALGLAAVCLFQLSPITAQAYTTTMRETDVAPAEMEYGSQDLSAYEKLCDNENFTFYFRDDRDVLAICDKRNGYTWKTGIDAPFANDLKDNPGEPKEEGLNATYIGIANSLVTVEYYEKESLKYVSSASEKGAKSTLKKLDGSGEKWCLEVDFTKLDVQLKVYLTFDEKGVHYSIPASELEGDGLEVLAAIQLTPFAGASGGSCSYYDEETGEYGEEEKKYRIPGYAFLPDGCGTLVRFGDNDVSFKSYVGDVYGADAATDTYYESEATDAVELKSPVVPVFGMAHGNDQAAFVAYAEAGSEYMQVVMNPEGSNMIPYDLCYPRFQYNTTYYQVYNKTGAGYFTMMKDMEQFDINITYEFPSGDGSDGTPSADYVGMAKAYREHLIETGVLTPVEADKTDIPLRLDFIMADSKKGVMGNSQVVVTTAEDTEEILSEIQEQGITNVNCGLKGWQKGGETLSKPWKASFSSEIGTKKDFAALFETMGEKGVELSFARDFFTINEKSVTYWKNAAKHANSWYLEVDNSAILPDNCPVKEFGYAVPEKSAEWLLELAEDVESFSEGFTVSGISNHLVSSFDTAGRVVSVTDGMESVSAACEELSETLTLSMDNPNEYLWAYTSRYLNMPVTGSQYVFETDTVPFLQMVLQGTMEVYAEYSNFSFYTQRDILTMMDYNMSPSFILSKEPSWYLADTNSANLYSTEYAQYKDLIVNIYEQVNGVLSQVSGWNWTDRQVVTPGVICNTYENGKSMKKVYINYSEEKVVAGEVSLEPLSAVVVD